MEKNPKKSKALIITIILIVLLLIAGYFIFKNKDSLFGMKTSTNTFTPLPASENFFTKLFSPLIPSSNSKNLTTSENVKTTYAEAGENIKKGDVVYQVGTNKNNLPIVRKTGLQNQNKFGTALEDINMGSVGNIAVDSSFWGSIKDWVSNIFGNNPNNTCANGADNPPTCTTIGGNCINNATNPPDCTTIGNDTNTDNNTNIFPTVTVTATPALIAKNESSTISWESTNADTCNAGAGNGTGKTGSFGTGALTASRSYTVTCTGVNGTGSGNVLVIVGSGGENVCPVGWTGTYPVCTDPNSNSCPVGWTGTFPNCTNTGNCPVGWTGTYPVCTNPNSNVCPPGWIGTYPDCTDPNFNVCPVGWTGTFPDCTNVGGCPAGWTGTYPKCTAPNFIFPTIAVWATPPIVEYGEVSEIGWESKNTEYCVEGAVGNASPDGSVNNKKGIKGTLTTGALLSSKSFTITCYDKNGGGGGVSGSVVVFVNPAGIPDLRATDPTPTTVLVGVNTMFYSDIINQGTASTGETTFYNLMQWANKPAPTTTGTTSGTTGTAGDSTGGSSDSTGNSSSQGSDYYVDKSKLIPHDLPSVRMKNLPAGESQPFTIIYKFENTGTYYIRVCADKQSQTNDGNINEGTNESNNCSDWVELAVTNSLPPPDDVCTNGTTNYPLCTILADGTCKNNATNPPQCDVFTCPEGETNPPDCTTPPVEVNICKDIEQNPLTFTPEEKARLDVLLRKFYLISSTLRTSDDISTIYNDIDNQENFMNQIDGLTKQCYLQINDYPGFNDFCSRNKGLCTPNPTTKNAPFLTEFEAEKAGAKYSDKYYTAKQNLTQRRGNPWYEKIAGKTPTGSFPYTDINVLDSLPPYTAGYVNYSWLDGNYSSEADGKGNIVYTHPADSPGCKVVSGYYYGTATTKKIDCPTTNDVNPCEKARSKIIEIINAGGDCDKLNDPLADDGAEPPQKLFNNCYYINTQRTGNFGAPPSEVYLNAGCKWKDGVDLENTERILNIW